jgi:hypothetical protein
MICKTDSEGERFAAEDRCFIYSKPNIDYFPFGRFSFLRRVSYQTMQDPGYTHVQGTFFFTSAGSFDTLHLACNVSAQRDILYSHCQSCVFWSIERTSNCSWPDETVHLYPLLQDTAMPIELWHQALWSNHFSLNISGQTRTLLQLKLDGILMINL